MINLAFISLPILLLSCICLGNGVVLVVLIQARVYGAGMQEFGVGSELELGLRLGPVGQIQVKLVMELAEVMLAVFMYCVCYNFQSILVGKFYCFH